MSPALSLLLAWLLAGIAAVAILHHVRRGR